jgi:hypothetical protein
VGQPFKGNSPGIFSLLWLLHIIAVFSERRNIIEQEIVLDKSFICTARGAQVREVCDTYRAFMPEDLFFELIHDDKEKRALSFAKFPTRDNPVGLLLPVGSLMQFENEYRHPSTPIWKHRVDIHYSFNRKLATGEFDMLHQQLEGVRQWERDLAIDAAHFAERARVIDKIFPVLQGYRPGQDRARIDEVLRNIASNMEGVRGFYKGVAPSGFPPAPIVGRTWAVFRYFQVHLTADVEFFAKYGVDVNAPNMAKLENERADLNYLLFALLAKGLATNDEAMKRRFRLLCPDGVLIEPEKRKN